MDGTMGLDDEHGKADTACSFLRGLHTFDFLVATVGFATEHQLQLGLWEADHGGPKESHYALRNFPLHLPHQE